jgi:hypothetical protein
VAVRQIDRVPPLARYIGKLASSGWSVGWRRNAESDLPTCHLRVASSGFQATWQVQNSKPNGTRNEVLAWYDSRA